MNEIENGKKEISLVSVLHKGEEEGMEKVVFYVSIIFCQKEMREADEGMKEKGHSVVLHPPAVFNPPLAAGATSKKRKLRGSVVELEQLMAYAQDTYSIAEGTYIR